MAKSKKKKKDKKGALSTAKVTKRLKDMTQNPLVADIVAAALVAAAAALKDTKRARRLAASAGDEIEELAREGADRGSALWKLALDVGRRSVEALAGEEAPKRSKARAKPKQNPNAPKRPKTKARSSRSPKK